LTGARRRIARPCQTRC